MLFLPMIALGQSEPVVTVTVDPLTTALGYVHLQVERKLSPAMSVYLGPHLRLFDGLLTEGHEPFVGYGAELGVRVFPFSDGLEGGWIMGRTVVAALHTTGGPKQRSFGGYSSVLVGYTGVLGEHLVLAGGAGVNQLYYDVGEYGSTGTFPALHTNIGVAF